MARALKVKPALLTAIIGDEDTVTGLLLGGAGNVEGKNSNFLLVRNETPVPEIRKAFMEFTQKRTDIGIVVINQHIANIIRSDLDDYDKMIPTILEIPSKDHPYNPAKDFIMNKVARITGQTFE
mmetsp:Transcript_19118/g.32488  ORF Transcript_19118/g.32488 Transcript_19118/m.32488 type:complete len:124 (+) Transcript_19118:26-397(+)